MLAQSPRTTLRPVPPLSPRSLASRRRARGTVSRRVASIRTRRAGRATPARVGASPPAPKRADGPTRRYTLGLPADQPRLCKERLPPYTSSHSRTVLSQLPDATCFPSGLKHTEVTEVTALRYPSSVLTHAPVSASHSRTVLS